MASPFKDLTHQEMWGILIDMLAIIARQNTDRTIDTHQRDELDVEFAALLKQLRVRWEDVDNGI